MLLLSYLGNSNICIRLHLLYYDIIFCHGEIHTYVLKNKIKDFHLTGKESEVRSSYQRKLSVWVAIEKLHVQRDSVATAVCANL